MVQNGVRKQYSRDGVFVKLCGLCASHCTFCEKGIEQSQASKYGCCYSCFHDVPEKIARMQAKKRADMAAQITLLEAKVVQIHAGDLFRGFSDFAIEHRVRTQAAHHRAQLWQEFERDQKARGVIHEPQVYMQYESENDENVQENRAGASKNGHTPVLIRQTHDKWIATQVEIQKRRRKEAKESRQRGVCARTGVQGESSKRG